MHAVWNTIALDRLEIAAAGFDPVASYAPHREITCGSEKPSEDCPAACITTGLSPPCCHVASTKSLPFDARVGRPTIRSENEIGFTDVSRPLRSTSPSITLPFEPRTSPLARSRQAIMAPW